MATHRARLTDDLNLALAFAVLGFPDYPAADLSVESLVEFKKRVDANWAEKLTAFQKARDAWAPQRNIPPTDPLTAAQSKLDAAERVKRKLAIVWEQTAPEVQESIAHHHERVKAVVDERIVQARAEVTALEKTLPVKEDEVDEEAVDAERDPALLREAFDTTFAEMMDARRGEELARALPAVWAGDKQATAWFERQVAIVRAYSPGLCGVL